jgi:hypothetical protein
VRDLSDRPCWYLRSAGWLRARRPRPFRRSLPKRRSPRRRILVSPRAGRRDQPRLCQQTLRAQYMEVFALNVNGFPDVIQQAHNELLGKKSRIVEEVP